MPIATRPIRKGTRKANRQKIIFTMLLPIPTGIRMTIQRKQQRTTRATELAFPLGRPLVPRELDRSFRALQLSLSVSCSGVGLSPGVAYKRSIAVTRLGGTHGGRVAPKLLKRRHFPVLVTNLVPKKNNPTFKLASWIVRLQLKQSS